LTNIKFGDNAEGHESRTLKESYLRGLRAFLDSQLQIHKAIPNVWTQVSHELYWATPGPGCDLAAIKAVCGFHIPPNDYSGCGPRRQQWNPQWKSKWGQIRRSLLRGCWNARRQFFAHRGLPLYSVEYYGAATINIAQNLTSKIQDRQICSWLMGMPSVYAGDLRSLTPENISHYRNRFDLLNDFQNKYNIYRYFQFSGVPKPTDLGWHWWGKINPEEGGIVVILRGRMGSSSKYINIPWVLSNRQYQVQSHFIKHDFGIYSGKQLQDGILKLSLPKYGQEIVELTLIKN
jgi:hypothetical protein